MKQLPFEVSVRPIWRDYRKELKLLQNDKKSESFPELYRKVCHHLALAEDRGYSEGLIKELRVMVQEGHYELHRSSGNFHRRLGRFFAHDFPRHVRNEKKMVMLSALLFTIPAALTLALLQAAPHWIYLLMSDDQLENFANMYDPEGMIGAPREIESQVGMWAFYIYNNVSIDFRAFAGGIVFGLGSAFVLVYNGLVLGAAAAHMNSLGYQETFYGFVIGHSSLELVAMVIAGAAGLVLGRSLLCPGQLKRIDALQQSAKVSVRLLIGASVMTFLAAFIEAYWSSRSDVPFQIKMIMGSTFWFLTILYFFRLGKERG